jgi:hypothetical protein
MTAFATIAIAGLAVPRLSAQDRAALGVAIDDDAAGGAKISYVYPGSPAERIGLTVGDRVVAVDKQAVANKGGLVDLIAKKAVNATVTVEVVRDGGRATFTVPLGKADDVLREPAVVTPVYPYQPGTVIYRWYPNHHYYPSRYRSGFFHNFFNRPDAGGDNYIPPPIPPTPPTPPPPIIVN